MTGSRTIRWARCRSFCPRLETASRGSYECGERHDEPIALCLSVLSIYERTEFVQVQQTALAMEDAGPKANALRVLADRLAQAHEYARLLGVTQQAWPSATTRDTALDLLPLVNGLIVRTPDGGAAFRESFAWVTTCLT